MPLFIMQELLNKYNITVPYTDILKMWDRDPQSYHNQTHLFDLYRQIELEYKPDTKEWELLTLAAMFHDIIYDTKSTDNESLSAKFLLDHCSDITEDINMVHLMIIDTISHHARTAISEIFQLMDMDILNRSYIELITYEKGIFFEFGYHPDYKALRLKFLESVLEYSNNMENLTKLVEYVKLRY